MPETKLDNEKLAIAATDALHAFMETMEIAYPPDGGEMIAISHLFQGLFHRWHHGLTKEQQRAGLSEIVVKLHQAIFDNAAKTYLEPPAKPEFW